MCSRVTCRQCGKATWSGCGQHVEEALYGVPKDQRCPGHPQQKTEAGFFSKMFGSK